MNHHRERTYRQRLYRSRRDKVFSGLCGGMAEYYGVSAGMLRFVVILGAVFTFPAVPLFYLIMVFLVPLEGSDAWHKRETRAYREEPTPKFRNNEEAMSYLNHQFDIIESKVRRMEDVVTSKDYVLERKFQNL